MKSRGWAVPGLWFAAAVVWLSLLAWPFLAEAVLMADDVALSYAHLDPPQAFHSWDSWVYRPVEGLSSRLIDPATRASAKTVLVHLPGLAGMAGVLWWVLGRLGADRMLAFPAGALWLAASTATSISLWQPDTVGQTWNGALGGWLMIATWTALEQSRQGRLGWLLNAAVAALTLAGLFTRELFYGWPLAAALLVTATAFAVRHRPSRITIRDALRLLIPLLATPLVFVILRYTTGGLRLLLDADVGGYGPRIGTNLVTNLMLSVGGLTATGPIHALLSLDAPLLIDILAVMSTGVTALLVALPWVTVRHSSRPPLGATLLVAAAAFGGLIAAFPVEQLSEHYVFGPSLAVSVLVGAGVAHTAADPGGRRLLALIVLLAVVAGSTGLVSRARHFAVSWDHVRTIHNGVLGALDASEGDLRIYVPARYLQGPQHSTYVMAPASLYSLDQTESYLDRATPGRSIRIEAGGPMSPQVGDFVLDVPLRPRPNW